MNKTEIKNMAAEIVWDAVQELPDTEHEESWCDEDLLVRAVYLGSAIHIMPSGKYYTPWANSNVDPCDVCNGRGEIDGAICEHCDGIGSYEAYLDQLMVEALDEEAEKFDCIVGSGEGCATDIFLYQFTRINEEEDGDGRLSQDPCVPHGQLTV